MSYNFELAILGIKLMASSQSLTFTSTWWFKDSKPVTCSLWRRVIDWLENP